MCLILQISYATLNSNPDFTKPPTFTQQDHNPLGCAVEGYVGLGLWAQVTACARLRRSGRYMTITGTGVQGLRIQGFLQLPSITTEVVAN